MSPIPPGPVSEPALPASCIKGAPAPWSKVFALLLREAGRKGRTQASIARAYGVKPKEITRWSTLSEDTESRTAPIWAVRRLAHELGYAVVVLPDQVLLVPLALVLALLPPES